MTAQGNGCGAVLSNGQATGTFLLRNDGNSSLTISKATLRNGGISGRFTLTPDITGQTIPVLGSLEAKIAYRDTPLFVSDVLTVEATAGGQPAGQRARPRWPVVCAPAWTDHPRLASGLPESAGARHHRPSRSRTATGAVT